MKTIITLSLVALLAGCAYSHVASTTSTFQQPTQGGPLELHVGRHLDTILKGPDVEEDQELILKVRNVRLNQRLNIPSDDVTAEFNVTRFGPSSEGESYTGYLILRKVTKDRVEAKLHIDVIAHTHSGTYQQTAKFHGDYSFLRDTDDNSSRP